MDLRQLRYFLALNEHRSFVRGAEATGITQPAFSRAIRGLEEELGCLLVDRGDKELRPTPEGKVVLQHALALVRGANNLTQEIGRMTKLDAGELRFGCGPAPAARLVPDGLRLFMQRYPRIHTRLEVNNWEHLSRSLAREEIEFFIADTRQFEAEPNFQTQPLQPRPGLFYCRPGHPLLAKESLSTNDLFDYPLVGSRLPSGVRKALANLSGRTDLELHLECDHPQILREVVCGSDAIGLSSLEALRQPLQQGEVVRLQPRNLPAGLDNFHACCGIVTRTGFRLSPAARAMIELLRRMDRGLLPHSAAA
ncbi:LysR family transcriptional regulator [Stutzerimonas kirkiae]|uniref:LysR family transcriptional regulator n=1 Tax=Stutzerimonas kirkiae TaxID=2211392 RepID=A0A4Q9R9L7_9GAMM|nr:LysR family transcriptional regulator [Stutzerimonas kirkiae]TBU97379.1 LysR family transcriptional regulator [Stutzerimonas kirkiae]TBV00354.1 LysR family transcriptional regulator [Stutzerimonas kirkiae]TBV10534.1 LysR family transcriptional regulator [Stutzerimonas kirkiae]